jgi:hypothetical protein
VFKVEVDPLPLEFSARSFPNPFNPSATIEANLPMPSDWNISIFNVSGQKVEEFTGSSPAGRVSVVWNASHMPSGMYLYKVTAGQYMTSNKMLLVK